MQRILTLALNLSLLSSLAVCKATARVYILAMHNHLYTLHMSHKRLKRQSFLIRCNNEHATKKFHLQAEIYNDSEEY